MQLIITQKFESYYYNDSMDVNLTSHGYKMEYETMNMMFNLNSKPNYDNY
jgi:hypothetical protein